MNTYPNLSHNGYFDEMGIDGSAPDPNALVSPYGVRPDNMFAAVQGSL